MPTTPRKGRPGQRAGRPARPAKSPAVWTKSAAPKPAASRPVTTPETPVRGQGRPPTGNIPPFVARITGLGGLGDGVARVDGEVVLVPGGVPGDLLRLRDTGKRGGVRRAEVTTVLEPSPARRTALCPVATACGGCSWQHVSDDLQQETRREQLARSVGLAAEVVLLGMPVPAFGYRRRARLHVRARGNQLDIGFHAKASDELVAIQSCPILIPALSACLPGLAAVLSPYVDRGEIQLLAGLLPGLQSKALAVSAVITGKPKKDAVIPADLASAVLLQTGMAGVELTLGHVYQQAGHLALVLEETATTCPIAAEPAGFAQASAVGNLAIRQAVHTLLSEVLAERAAAKLPPLSGLWEWYAGSGNLTAVVAPLVPAIRAVEADRDACLRLQNHVLPWLQAQPGPMAKVEVVEDDADLEQLPLPDHVAVLLDPGRPGAKALCSHLAGEDAGTPARDILYVSCAFDTLRRDAKILRDAGWHVRKAVLVDTYAQTPRGEAVVWLSRQAPPTV